MPKSLILPANKSSKAAAIITQKAGGVHPLAGVWSNGFKEEDDVRVIIAGTVDDFKVKVISNQDGEEANVYEPVWDGEALSFNIYWNSIGRFIKCRMQILDDKKVSYTYTHTATEQWRKVD